MDDSHDCLGPKNFANRKLLYQQKCFSEVCNFLNEINQENFHSNYLLAVGNLIEKVPNKVLQINFSKVIKILTI